MSYNSLHCNEEFDFDDDNLEDFYPDQNNINNYDNNHNNNHHDESGGGEGKIFILFPVNYQSGP